MNQRVVVFYISEVVMEGQNLSSGNGVKSYHVSLYRNNGSLRYSGQMVGHQKEGWGTEYNVSGQVLYSGNWQKDRIHI